MRLVEALDADQGVVSVVGAGGKKSTMYRLAEQLDRPLLTSTVRIPIFDQYVERVIVTDDPVEAVANAEETHWPLGVVSEQDGSDRYLGYHPSVIDTLSGVDEVQTILVKADGARMRKFKAPGENEPQLPSSTSVVVPIVSAHVIGEPLSDEIVHRVDRVAHLTGLSRGDTITPSAVAVVIASPDGGHKGVPEGASVVPLINMVDDGSFEDDARRAAEEILRRCDAPRVILTRLTASNPVVDTIGRS